MAPSQLRGYLYPTTSKYKCPRYSACLVTQKCQNYDRHCRLCFMCETRVNPPLHLGGCLPEGENGQDVQLAMKTLKIALNKAFNDPNQDTPGTASFDVENQDEIIHSSQVMENWSRQQTTEEDVDVQVDRRTYEQIQGMI